MTHQAPGQRQYRILRIQAFAMTWLAYAGFYFCRANWSIVKSAVGEDLGLSTVELGQLDTTYLALYAVGQFVSGWLGDRIGGARLVGLGLILTALCNVALGSSHGMLFLVAGFAVNGLAQSAGWPGCAKTFSQWFAQRERGQVMGWWCTCYQAGYVLAGLLATWLLAEYGWRTAFFVPALLIGGFGLVFLKVQKPSPSSAGLPSVESYYAQVTGTEPPVEDAAPPDPWGDTLLVLKSRDIWTLGLTYVVLKFIRYSFIFWLPFYLSNALGYSDEEAGYTSLIFGVAGIAGAVFAGTVSDRVHGGRRAPICVIMMGLLAVALFGFSAMPDLGRVGMGVALFGIGFLIYGPDSVAAGVAAVDFGTKRAASKAAGMVNGLGSIGAALSGVVIGYVSDGWGWSAVFNLFVPLTIIGALLMATMWNRVPQGA
ncbi:MAG: MFS transporter [Proteobacteria bacterium]|nr:MFS transporter [Pseudomonadota bacterium]MCP4918368.1 MFS transporter [Pseudomonadota bacterium]